MNINVILKCNTCGKLIHCRIGISYNTSQPLRFVCPTCRSPIDADFNHKASPEDASLQFSGASNQDDTNIADAEHFVDLHLDFPIFYGDYVMGMTPFIRATEMIGFDNVRHFANRIGIIDQRTKETEEIKNIIRLYITENWDLYQKKMHEYFSKDQFPCELPIDRNQCLYQFLELAFMAHNDPEENVEFVTTFSKDIYDLSKRSPEVLNNFLDEVISTGFLKELQKECLEIYPRILDAHLILRQAIFLDYLNNPEFKTIALRVSNSKFEDFKDLYKDMSEILSRQLILVAGLSNITVRKSHNLFDVSKAGAPPSLEKFADFPYGKKMDFIDEPAWHEICFDLVDNQLRNAIAHHKTDYDPVGQVLTYYPRLEGLQRSRSENITFLEFSRKILETFRLMHKLNHLIKILYVFHYFDSEKHVE